MRERERETNNWFVPKAVAKHLRHIDGITSPGVTKQVETEDGHS